MDLMQQIIEAIGIAGLALEKNSAENREHARRAREAASVIPQLVEALIKADLIDHHEKAAACRVLADPAEALHLFTRFVSRYQELQASSPPRNDVPTMGTPHSNGMPKRAAASAQSAADRAYFLALDLPHLVRS